MGSTGSLRDALERLLGRLDAHGARFAVVGGLAVSARTEPRFTRDADVCVAVDDDREAERLVGALERDGYAVDAIVEQVATGRLASVRLAEREHDDGIALDLLFASSGIEDEVVGTADELELIEGVRAPVATVAALIGLKVLARDDVTRPQDRVDLVSLVRAASQQDLAEARRLLDAVTVRGYARGRDLARLLTQLLEELGR